MKFLSKLGLVAILSMMFVWQSCTKDDPISSMKNVNIVLSYEAGIALKSGVNVKARATDSGVEYAAKTDDEGKVTFTLQVGEYEFSATESRSNNGKLTSYNALSKDLVGTAWNSETDKVTLNMTGSKKSQLIIKEVYTGGVLGGNGRNYSFGKYLILYNNSSEDVDLKNLCIGSSISNSYFMKYEIKAGDTEPYWFKEDWTPVSMGYFYFPNSTIIKPYKELVVALDGGGVNHSVTHSNAVNLDNSEYYIQYDPESGFNNSRYYPAPSASISPDHYLKGVKFGLGNALSGTTSCPHYVLFYPEQTPVAYGADMTNLDFWRDNDRFPRKKIRSEWISDAVDSFTSGKTDQYKRVNPQADAGYLYHIAKKGYTLYRNVDKDATEAIDGNKAKLVYNYTMGTNVVETKDGSTDPSGIDAEASIANGAVIIYKDTNNSGNDFHLRQKSSLRN